MNFDRRLRGLAAASMAHFVNDGVGYVFFMLYPFLVKLYGLGILQVAILAAIQNISSILASPFIGLRSDRSRRYSFLLAAGLALMGIGMGGYSLASLVPKDYVFYVLIPFTVLGGVGTSFYHPIGGTVVSTLSGAGSTGRAMGINGAFGSLGRAFYPLFVVALLALLGFSGVAVVGLTALGASVLVGRLTGNVTGGRQAGGTGVVRSVITVPLLALTILSFFRGLFAQGVITFLPVYLSSSGYGYGYALGGVIAAINGMGILSQYIFGHMTDRKGGRFSITVAGLGSVIAVVAFLLTPYTFVVLPSLLLFGLFTFNYFPLVMSVVDEISDEENRTSARSLVWGVGNVGGGAAGPFIVGLLAEPSLLGSLKSSFYVVCAIGFLSILLITAIRPRRK